MARGVDTTAHRGTLCSEQGSTIAVLGYGNRYYISKKNARLMHEIVQKDAVIMKFPLGSKPSAWHFSIHNHIISGHLR